LSIVVSLYWSLSGLVTQAPISKKITVGRPGDFSVEQLMAVDYVLIPKSISLKTFYYSMMISALLFLYIQKKKKWCRYAVQNSHCIFYCRLACI
jgi:hypothetical protein